MTVLTPRPARGRLAPPRAGRTGAALVATVVALGASAYGGGAEAADGGAEATGGAPADGSLFAEAAAVPTIDQLPAIVLNAHRAGGLEARENSVSGIRHALASGVVDVIDLDVRRLADGALGVMHDPTVDRVTTSSGPTASYTREQWQTLTLDIGSWLVPRPRPEAPPTLSQVLDQFGHRSVFSVEVKEGLVDEVAQLLHARSLTDSVFVNTNDPDVARLIHQMGLRSHLWRTASQMRTDDPRSFAGFVDLLDIDVRAGRADFRRSVASGVPLVWAHTVTTRAERNRALRLGATGVVSDDPRYVAGVTDTFPVSPTVVDLRRAPEPVQVSDRTSARLSAASQSGTALRAAVASVTSPQLTGRTVERNRDGVSTLRLSAARAERGRTDVTFRVAAGRKGERRWPTGQTSVPLHVTGEDLQLVPSVKVGRRGLRVRVRLLDSAAAAYAGPRAEHRSRVRTVADLRRAEVTLRVVRRGAVVDRQRVAGVDTGRAGDGDGTLRFRPWDAPRHGWCTVRLVQRGSAYRRVVVERRVRLG